MGVSEQCSGVSFSTLKLSLHTFKPQCFLHLSCLILTWTKTQLLTQKKSNNHYLFLYFYSFLPFYLIYFPNWFVINNITMKNFFSFFLLSYTVVRLLIYVKKEKLVSLKAKIQSRKFKRLYIFSIEFCDILNITSYNFRYYHSNRGAQDTRADIYFV